MVVRLPPYCCGLYCYMLQGVGTLSIAEVCTDVPKDEPMSCPPVAATNGVLEKIVCDPDNIRQVS